MRDKYYTPNLEEFGIGFEYEVKLMKSTAGTIEQEVWEKCKFGTKSKGEDILKGEAIKNNVCFIDNLLPIISSGCIRSKYLDEEDIENLGFNKLTDIDKAHEYSMTESFSNYTYVKSGCKIKFFNHDENMNITTEDGTLFIGKIKNLSELKRILKQMGFLDINSKGAKGHKGAIGLPGNYKLPDHVIEIINFRNEKIEQDYELSNYNLEKVDKKYDRIDSAISKVVEGYTPCYTNGEGVTGPTGGCHLGCPAGVRRSDFTKEEIYDCLDTDFYYIPESREAAVDRWFNGEHVKFKKDLPKKDY